MARAAGHNTAGSQFFIVHEDATFLDKQYAAFGRVVEGMDVVDAIAATPTNASDRPDTPQVMKSVTLTEDETVEEPEKM
jgi:peptidyl-prolyl cis-trans isomerase B (cyclophilin B)